MNTCMANDPRDVVVGFVSNLPRTIRDEMLMFLMLYGEMPEGAVRPDVALREHLMAGGLSAVGRTIGAMAVIDFSLDVSLARTVESEPVLKTLSEEWPDDLAFRESYLSLPLRSRHWEQARSAWRHLRATKLTPRTLRDFEETQLGLRQAHHEYDAR